MSNNKSIKGFTQVPNYILSDPKLSIEAKGLLAILLSNAAYWKIQITEIYRRSINSEARQRRVLKELIDNGLVVQEKKRNPKTKRFEWKHIINVPRIFKGNPIPDTHSLQVEIPLVENADMEKPSLGKPPINNTDETIQSEKETQEKYIKKKIPNTTPIIDNTILKGHTSNLADGDDELPF